MLAKPTSLGTSRLARAATALVKPRQVPARAFTWRERCSVVLEILFAYAELLPVLRRNDLPRMVECARAAPATPPRLADGYDVQIAALRLALISQAVVRRLPTDRRCLINSLVAVRVLANRGVDARLVIGVRSTEEKFEAHAWVARADHPLLPPGDFEPILEL